MKNLVHQQPYKDPMKCRPWKTLLFEFFFFLLISLWLDFVFMITTLEIILPSHTWNIIISSKPYFVIIKIKINQTLVLQYAYHINNCETKVWLILVLMIGKQGLELMIIFQVWIGKNISKVAFTKIKSSKYI